MPICPFGFNSAISQPLRSNPNTPTTNSLESVVQCFSLIGRPRDKGLYVLCDIQGLREWPDCELILFKSYKYVNVIKSLSLMNVVFVNLNSMG